MRSRRFTIHGGGLPSLLEKSAKPVVGTEPLRGVEEETDGVKRKRRFVTPIAHDRLEAGGWSGWSGGGEEERRRG